MSGVIKCGLATASLLNLFILFGVFYDGTHAVRINRLQVPEIAKSGQPVVLDCEYSLEEALDEGLVVKWFFNEILTPVYQWIPHKKPRELGILKGRLDLDYSVSVDKLSSHRALRILQPAPDLSGDYTCLVSTFNSEDRQTKRMLVLVPEKRLDLRQKYMGNGMFQILCNVEGVYPKPYVSLQIGDIEMNNTRVSVQENNGLFDVKVISEVPTLEGPKEISCELKIPQANYTVRKEAIYYPAATAGRLRSSVLLELAATLTIKYLYVKSLQIY